MATLKSFHGKKNLSRWNCSKIKTLLRGNWRDNIEKDKCSDKFLLDSIQYKIVIGEKSGYYLRAIIRTTFTSAYCVLWAIILNCSHGCSILWRISHYGLSISDSWLNAITDIYNYHLDRRAVSYKDWQTYASYSDLTRFRQANHHPCRSISSLQRRDILFGAHGNQIFSYTEAVHKSRCV